MKINKAGIKWGLIAGALTIIVYVGAYAADPKLYFNSGLSWSIVALNILAMFMASREARNIFLLNHDLAEEPYSFNVALQPPFVTYLITTLAFYILNYIMFNFVNPELADLQQTFTLTELEKQRSMLESLMGEDKFDEMMEGIEEQDFSVTIGSSFLGLATSLLGGFLLSAIFALIFKKNQIERLS